MATFCYWIYRRWSLSRITGLVLISNYKSQVTAPVSAASHRLLSWSSARVTSLPHKNLCGLKNLRSCSSGADSVPQKGGLIVTETSLLLNATCSHEKAEVSSPAKETFPTDLDVIPPPSPFEEISDEEAVQIEGREVLPPASFTLRDYIDQSDTLRRLVLLGVDLSKLEQRPNVANMLLRLDFDKNVKECLLFLKDLGVEEHQFGAFLTKNPFILTESLENLQKRVSYLQSKKFSKEAIARMVSRAPYLLNFSVERLDNKLGFYHKELGLNVQKTRELITRLPSLLTGSLESVKENLKVYRIEFGFQENELQHMVMKVPKMLVASKKKVTVVFDYLHNIMGIPHRLLTNFPQVFNTKLLRIKERHLFLEHLGRAQYDPVQPNYVSLDKLVATPDDVFCMEIAKATLPDFEAFQKTL